MLFVLQESVPPTVPLSNPRALLATLPALRRTIEAEGQHTFHSWERRIWHCSNAKLTRM